MEALTSPTRPATVGPVADWVRPVADWVGPVAWLTPVVPSRPGQGPAAGADEADRRWAPRHRAAATHERRLRPRVCCGRSDRCRRWRRGPWSRAAPGSGLVPL